MKITIKKAYDKIKACKNDCATCKDAHVNIAGASYAHYCAIADKSGMRIYSNTKTNLKAETIKGLEWELNISRHTCENCPKHNKPTCSKCPIY